MQTHISRFLRFKQKVFAGLTTKDGNLKNFDRISRFPRFKHKMFAGLTKAKKKCRSVFHQKKHFQQFVTHPLTLQRSVVIVTLSDAFRKRSRMYCGTRTVQPNTPNWKEKQNPMRGRNICGFIRGDIARTLPLLSDSSLELPSWMEVSIPAVKRKIVLHLWKSKAKSVLLRVNIVMSDAAF